MRGFWRQCAQPYDKDAGMGERRPWVISLAAKMLLDPVLYASAPKSTVTEYFNFGWLERHLTAFLGADARAMRPRWLS